MTWAILLVLAAVAAVPVLRERMRKPMDATVRRAAEGSFADLSQGLTHYDWLGPAQGPVAVCVHGLTTPSFVWRGLARLGYRVLIYDLYGRGYSDRPRGRQDAAFFLRQLDDLLADQRVTGAVTLLGYSMGGAIATAFAARSPNKVRQLVLLASAGMSGHAVGLGRFVIRTPVIGDLLMYTLYPRRHRHGAEADRGLPNSVEQIVDRQLTELDYRGFVPAVLASMRGILGRPLEAEHRAIHRAHVPVLAIWGRADDVIALSAMGTLAEWSRTAQQEIIGDAGHGLIYSHTDAVLATIQETLRDRVT